MATQVSKPLPPLARYLGVASGRSSVWFPTYSLWLHHHRPIPMKWQVVTLGLPTNMVRQQTGKTFVRLDYWAQNGTSITSSSLELAYSKSNCRGSYRNPVILLPSFANFMEQLPAWEGNAVQHKKDRKNSKFNRKIVDCKIYSVSSKFRNKTKLWKVPIFFCSRTIYILRNGNHTGAPERYSIDYYLAMVLVFAGDDPGRSCNARSACSKADKPRVVARVSKMQLKEFSLISHAIEPGTRPETAIPWTAIEQAILVKAGEERKRALSHLVVMLMSLWSKAPMKQYWKPCDGLSEA